MYDRAFDVYLGAYVFGAGAKGIRIRAHVPQLGVVGLRDHPADVVVAVRNVAGAVWELMERKSYVV
jgi:hypothetical protein